MISLLREIYGDAAGQRAFERIAALLGKYGKGSKDRRPGFFSHDDVVLITYGDSLLQGEEKTLHTFKAFADVHFRDVFSHIHLLPIYPFSSDDGFSVKNFTAVRPDLGDWPDIASIGKHFKLMFDYVLNHISSESEWFLKYLSGEEGFRDLAIEIDPAADLSSVVRPRALPLLTPFEKDSGIPVWLWTTFSSDQVDLSYRSIDVLVRMIDVLLFYVSKGASMIRMDAVAYLWKEIGTPCIHLPQTHLVVKLFRCILDTVAPQTVIITETNVPHRENISYFGDGTDEAQMVYNFTLPPLLLHTFLTGDATPLSLWAECLRAPSLQTTFFNFSASHDGIGVRPLEGVLPPEAVDRLVAQVAANKGRVSAKSNTDGTESPYELNISFADALLRGEDATDTLHVRRFLAAQAIPLVLPGVPAVYIHSILGSRNWQAGVAMTGRARAINRERLDVRRVTDDLENTRSFRARVFYPYSRLIRLRRQLRALHPNADSHVLHLDAKVFGIRRGFEGAEVTALTNVSGERVAVSLPMGDRPLCDLISGRTHRPSRVELAPYQTVWLAP